MGIPRTGRHDNVSELGSTIAADRVKPWAHDRQKLLKLGLGSMFVGRRVYLGCHISVSCLNAACSVFIIVSAPQYRDEGEVLVFSKLSAPTAAYDNRSASTRLPRHNFHCS